MALVVNTNIASLNSQYSLSQSRSALEQAMERLSSGSKINSAGDDAAGLSIATRMDSQVRGLQAAISNANDGVSLLQTAEGAMEEITAMLQRMRELAVQAGNGTNNDSDREALNAEAQQLLAEIDRVVGDTTFNNKNILDGSMTTNLQVGSETGQSLQVALGNLSTYSLGADIASSSGSVQREASFAGSAVGATDANGNNLVTATVATLGFESDDTYHFVLSMELYDNDGAAQTYEYDISGVVTGGSARDVAAQIQEALRKPPMSADGAIDSVAAADAGTLTEVINSAADFVDVTYSGNQVRISNNLGGDVSIEAGNYQTTTGIQTTISGAVSDSGGVIRFNTTQFSEQDGSLISNASNDNVIIGTQPSYQTTAFTIQSAPSVSSGSGVTTEATPATLEVSFAEIGGTTNATANAISDGDTIAFTLVDETGDSVFVYTDNVNGIDSSTNLVAAINNALISAGADDEYAVAWNVTTDGGSADGSETVQGSFVITRADGTNFTIKMGGTTSGGTAISSSFANTDSEFSGTMGMMRVYSDLAVADSSYETSDGDITLNFSDEIAGSVGSTNPLTAGDGFTLTLTDETGNASTIYVADLQDGSSSTVAAALNTAFSNAGVTDRYSAAVETSGSDATGGITITHGSDSTFTLEFSDLTLNGATTGITTVIHEKLDDLEFSSATSNNLFSTDGVRANTSAQNVSTSVPATMYLDVMGADTYTMRFSQSDGTGATGELTYTYNGTAASLDTFASRIASNLTEIGGGFAFEVTAEDGRIAITETSGDGFRVFGFSSEGSGRIMASADSSLIASGDDSIAMLDETSYATNATADAGAASVNVTATSVQLSFTDATDTYSFAIETADGTAKVNPFLYEAANGEQLDAVAAIQVALNSAGLDGSITVATGTASTDVVLTAADGSEIRIVDFKSEGSGQITAESLAGTFGSGVTRVLSDDVYGAANALANLDISSTNGATAALDAIDRAIQGVSDERANIGALTNRLDHTISNLGNIVVNTSAAQSRIQDADFAAEAAELAKAQVLQQAGTAILAQANASVQSVLSLLG